MDATYVENEHFFAQSDLKDGISSQDSVNIFSLDTEDLFSLDIDLSNEFSPGKPSPISDIITLLFQQV